MPRRERWRAGKLPGFIRLCDDPAPDEISLATLATSLRGQVQEGMISSAEADAELSAFKELLRRDVQARECADNGDATEPSAIVRGDVHALRQAADGLEALIAGVAGEH